MFCLAHAVVNRFPSRRRIRREGFRVQAFLHGVCRILRFWVGMFPPILAVLYRDYNRGGGVLLSLIIQDW